MDATRQQFRDAMARLGAAVNVVTTDGPAGRGGFTASAVCSVSDQPPTMLVCMNRGSSSRPLVQANGVLCVNVLAARQQSIADVFSGLAGILREDRFGHGEWETMVTGAPALRGAVASVDCVVEEMVEKGTHSVLFGSVRAVRLGEPEAALIWWARDYRSVGHPEE